MTMYHTMYQIRASEDLQELQYDLARRFPYLQNETIGRAAKSLYDEGYRKHQNQSGLTFDETFAVARKAGVEEFEWVGRMYSTKLKEEEDQEKAKLKSYRR